MNASEFDPMLSDSLATLVNYILAFGLLVAIGCESRSGPDVSDGNRFSDGTASGNDMTKSALSAPMPTARFGHLIRLTPRAAIEHGTEPEFFGQVVMMTLELDNIEERRGSKYEILTEDRRLLVYSNEIVSIDGETLHENEAPN